MRRHRQQTPCTRTGRPGPDRLRDLWPDCPARDLQALQELSCPLELRPGQLVAAQGRHGHEMLLLVEGEALVARGFDLVTTIRAGAPVGELALLWHAPRNATVFMATPGVGLVLTHPEVRSLTLRSRYFTDLLCAFAESRRRVRPDGTPA